MKCSPLAFLAVCVALFAAAQTPPPAEPPIVQPPQQDTPRPAPKPKKGRAAMLGKLNDDLGVAIANGKLDKKSANRLEKDRETLRQAASRDTKQKPDPKTVQKSLNSIQKVFRDKGEAFRAEDRAAVLEDLLDLRPAHTRQARSRPPRPMRMPRIPGPRRRPY